MKWRQQRKLFFVLNVVHARLTCPAGMAFSPLNAIGSIFLGDCITAMERVKAGGWKIIANAGWLYADHLVRAAIGVLVFSLVARSLGPGDYGLLSYAIAFPAMFLPLAGLGLDHVVIRDFVRHPEARDAIFSTAFAIKAAGAVVACAASFSFSTLLSSGPAKSLLLATNLTLIFQPVLTFDFYFQSQTAAKFPALARLITSIVGNIIRGYMAWNDAPVAWFAWALLGESALHAVALLAAWRASGMQWVHPWRCFELSIARRLLLVAWPLFLCDVAIAAYLKFDQILIGHLAPAAVLGEYAAAFRIADYAGFFAIALINSAFPTIVLQQQENPEALAPSIGRLMRRITMFCLGLALLITFGSPLIARLLLGEQYPNGWAVLAIVGWANVFAAQVAVRGKWFLLENKQLYSLAFFVGGAVVHLALVLLLVPRIGAIGAASAYFVAQFSIAITGPLLFTRTRGASGLALRSFWPARM